MTPDFWQSGGWTVAGPRSENQDYLVCSGRSLIVADGVGGGPGGQQAAELSCLAVDRTLRRPAPHAPPDVSLAFDAAKRALAEHARWRPEHEAAATTLIVVAPLLGDNDQPAVTVHWVGDSRAMLLRRRTLELFGIGGDEPSDSGALASWLSSSSLHRPSTARFDVFPGDVILLHTDGLDVLDDDVIAATLSGTPDRASPRVVARELAELAVAHGATDNVTVAVAVIPSPQDHPSLRALFARFWKGRATPWDRDR